MCWNGSAPSWMRFHPRYLPADAGAGAIRGISVSFGMLTIDQNDILKIFSVVTVSLLRPTVIAGFYGMNFERIPWLHEPWGWEAAVVLMVVSALVPYWIFKRKGWL